MRNHVFYLLFTNIYLHIITIQMNFNIIINIPTFLLYHTMTRKITFDFRYLPHLTERIQLERPSNPSFVTISGKYIPKSNAALNIISMYLNQFTRNSRYLLVLYKCLISNLSTRCALHLIEYSITQTA